MIDKTAIINAAQKFASTGNIDGAIAEWKKVLENGKDGNVQNTIGDLYLRKGAQTQAVGAFTKAAEIFSKAGFYPKAIAIYKKILNILPNHVESLIALAKLNAKRGLNANAADYYFKAADIYHRNGYAENATKAVERILKLSTTDLSIRKKIADWYIKAGIKPRAANEYAAIALSYLEKDDIVNAEKFFIEATELDPDNVSLFIGLSSLAEKTGDIELAFKHLEDAMSRDPHSKASLLAYSELAIRNNRLDAAKETLLKLIEEAPSNRARKLLGGLYLDENESEKAWEQLLPCIDGAINDKNWADAIEMLNKLRELHPVPVRERIIEIYRSTDDSENLSKEIKELAKLYEGQGSNDDAIRLYKELLESDPDNIEAADRIKELEPAPEPAVEKPMPAEETVKEETPLTEALLEKKVEADFYTKQGMNEEAAKIYEEILKASPDNAEIKNKLKELLTASGQSEEVVIKKMFKDEGESLTEEDPSSTTQDLQAIFDKFKKEDDYDAHYKAGMEYRQKGLLDEAIKEFKKAAEDPEKRLVSLSMLALCYMDKGDYTNAIKKFTSILESMSSKNASYIRIKYELAGVYIKTEENDKALKLYSEIKKQDSEFKDINEKITALKSLRQKTPENKKKTKPKKSRVSYI